MNYSPLQVGAAHRTVGASQSFSIATPVEWNGNVERKWELSTLFVYIYLKKRLCVSISDSGDSENLTQHWLALHHQSVQFFEQPEGKAVVEGAGGLGDRLGNRGGRPGLGEHECSVEDRCPPEGGVFAL